MSDFPASVRSKKKESRLGVLLTALFCGLFLWWWFTPGPVPADTERNPLYWVGLARERLGTSEPGLAQRLEIIMISEALRRRGDVDPAAKIEADWLPASWQAASPPAAGPEMTGSQNADTEVEPDPDLDPPATALPWPSALPEAFGPVLTRLDEAAIAFDALEIERGQTVLRDAAAAGAAMPEPARTEALWLVTARQARYGLAGDAAETRARQATAARPAELPGWLVAELLEGEIIAPVVAACAALPADHPRLIALAGQWRALVRRGLVDRDYTLIARLGPAADASQPPSRPPDAAAEAPASTLWSAVEANRLGEATRLAGKDPSAQLAIARLLVWLAGEG